MKQPVYIRKRQFKTAKSRYLETILQAIGQAGAAGYKSHIDTLFAMSHEIMGLTEKGQSDTMQTGAAKSGMKTEGNTMKIYFYTMPDYDGILIAHKNRWISFTDSSKIDGMYCDSENAEQIAENLHTAWKTGSFSETDFNDWTNDAQYTSNPAKSMTTGTNVKRFLESCETYREI